MFTGKFKKVFFFTLSGFLTFGVIVFIALAGLFFRLSSHPFNLDPYKETIEKSLREISSDFSIHFDHASLEWKSFFKPFRVKLEKISLETHGQSLAADIPLLYLKFNPFKLVFGNWVPTSVEVNHPHLEVDLKNIPAFDQSGGQKDTPYGVEHFLSEDSPLKKLKKIEIVEATIKMKGLPQELALWQETKLSLAIKSTFRGIEGFIDTKAEKSNLLTEFDYDYFLKEWEGTLKFHDCPLALLTSFLEKKLGYKTFAGADLTLSGKGEGTYSLSKGLKKASLSLEGAGKIDQRDFFEDVIPLSHLSLKADYKEDRLKLEKLSFKSDAINASLEGVVKIDHKDKKAALEITGNAYNVPIDLLKIYWPKSLAKVPRKWVTENIRAARVPAADLQLKGLASWEKEPSFKIDQLTGKIDVKGATVRYMEKMPVVTNVDGVATFDAQSFKIQVTSGLCQGQRIQKGDILITDVHLPDQNIALDLEIKGPFTNALELINHDPLNFIKKLGISPKGSEGIGHTFLKLKFPLETTVTFDQVSVQSLSTLQGIKLVNPVGKLPLVLSGGEFTLKVGKTKLEMKGKSLVNDSPSEIVWEKSFQDSEKIQNRLEVKSTLNPQTVKRFGWDLDKNFEGEAPIVLSYTSFGKIAELTSKIDLYRAKIAFLSSHKNAFSPGEIVLSLSMEENHPKEIKNFSMYAPGAFDIKGKALFQEKSSAIKKLDLDHIKIGKTQARASVTLDKTKTYQAKIQGTVLDLGSFMDDLDKTDSFEFGGPVVFDARFDQINLGENRTLFNNLLHFRWKGNKIVNMSCESRLSNHEASKKLLIFITSDASFQRKLTVQTDYAADLLKTLNISENVKGGTLVIKANHDSQKPNSPWMGRVQMKEFSLKKAPLLGKLLALAFPTGFMEFFTDEGMRFNIFSASFKYKSPWITITNGKATGVSLGLTIYGSLDLKKEMLDIHGNLIPAYFLNNLIAKIPLLGEFLSGGKNEGIFGVAYTISGPFSKPEVSVNPLTAFTPGLIRKIFSADEYKDKEDTFKDDKDEE
jgi:hypothetical protein